MTTDATSAFTWRRRSLPFGASRVPASARGACARCARHGDSRRGRLHNALGAAGRPRGRLRRCARRRRALSAVRACAVHARSSRGRAAALPLRFVLPGSLTRPWFALAAGSDTPEHAPSSEQRAEADELAELLAGARVSDTAQQRDAPKTPPPPAAEAADAAAAAAAASAKFAAFRAEQRGACCQRGRAAAVLKHAPWAKPPSDLLFAHALAPAERAQAANVAAEAAAAAEAEEAAAEAEQAADAKAFSRAAGAAPRVGLIHSADMEKHKGPEECVPCDHSAAFTAPCLLCCLLLASLTQPLWTATPSALRATPAWSRRSRAPGWRRAAWR